MKIALESAQKLPRTLRRRGALRGAITFGLCILLYQSAFAKKPKAAVASIKAPPATVLGPKEYKFTKKIDAAALQDQLIAAGFSVNYIDCANDYCTIHMRAGEDKDPMPIVRKYVYVDLFLERKKNVDSMRGLYSKWKDGTISPEEKDDLLKRLAAHVLGL